MFEMGFMELVLVAVIGLLVLGPQRLPKVAAEIGKWVGRARRTATQLRRQLEREIEVSEIENPPPRPPPARGAPSSGEVPPGPGTHADQPPSADEPTAEPTSAVPDSVNDPADGTGTSERLDQTSSAPR